jgi:hypothetical protein
MSDLEWHENKLRRRMEVAAPKMLKALKAVVLTSHGAGPEHWKACEQARKVIEEAEGELYEPV